MWFNVITAYSIVITSNYSCVQVKIKGVGQMILVLSYGRIINSLIEEKCYSSLHLKCILKGFVLLKYQFAKMFFQDAVWIHLNKPINWLNNLVYFSNKIENRNEECVKETKTWPLSRKKSKATKGSSTQRENPGPRDGLHILTKPCYYTQHIFFLFFLIRQNR